MNKFNFAVSAFMLLSTVNAKTFSKKNSINFNSKYVNSLAAKNSLAKNSNFEKSEFLFDEGSRFFMSADPECINNSEEGSSLSSQLSELSINPDQGNHVRILRWNLENKMTTADIMKKVNADKCIQKIADNGRLELHGHTYPTDNFYSNQMIFPLLKSEKAWESLYTDDQDYNLGNLQARIAIIDQGVLPHPDFLGNQLIMGGVPIARDIPAGKGKTTPTGTHGTKIAGLMMAQKDNGGMVGIGYNNLKYTDVQVSKLVNGNSVLEVADTVDGIYWAIQAGRSHILNISLGGAIGKNDLVHDAMEAALANDILVVVSAGNKGGELDCDPNSVKYSIIACTKIDYTSGEKRKGILVVASVDAVNNQLSAFSDWNYEVTQIAAYGSYDSTSNPAVGVYMSSAYDYYGDGSYYWWIFDRSQGTSFSAPIIAAAAGLIRNYNRKTSYQILPRTYEYILMSSAWPQSHLNQYIKNGRIFNFQRLMQWLRKNRPQKFPTN